MRHCLILLLFSISINAQQNISLLAKFPYPNILSNVWGYTDETNIEYALVGVEDGLSVVSLANPASPVEVAKIPGTLNSWREIKTYGDYAYVSSESGDGLLIVDLSPLPASTTLNYVYKTFTKNPLIANRAHTLAIDEKGYCYLFGTDRDQETIILDIKTNPMNPVEVGSTNLYYAHDGIIAGDTMFLAHINQGFVGVYNISDRANPQFVTSFETPLKFTHNIALSVDNKILFATDEKAGSFVAAYDISDFNNINEIDRFQRKPQNFSMVHNAHMNNGYLVSSYYLEGINIIDAHDPHNLVEVGFYDTTPNDSGYVFKGVWGVYPYFQSGVVVASDMEQGLFVFSVNYSRASYVSGTVQDASNSSPLNNVKVTIEGTEIIDYSKLGGTYLTGIGEAGNKTLHFSKAGYFDTTIVVSFVASVTKVGNVLMRKKPTANAMIKVVDKNTTPISNAKVLIECEDDKWLMTAQNNGVLVANLVGLNFKITIGKWMYLTACDEKSFADFTDTIVYILNEGIYDDFSFDFGWTTVGDASKGEWVRDIPFGTYFGTDTINPSVDVSNDCSAYAYVTGNSKNPDFTFNKVDQVQTELTSPLLDLSNFANPIISFYLWFDDYDQWNFANDSAFITMNNNSEIIYLDTIVGSLYSPREKWNLLEYDLSKFNLNFTNYQFKISAVDVLPHNALEVGLDVFQLSEKSAQNLNELYAQEIMLFPNPAGEVLHIQSKTALLNCELKDSQGKTIATEKLNYAQNAIIDLQKWPSGFYLLDLTNAENQHFISKILIMNR